MELYNIAFLSLTIVCICLLCLKASPERTSQRHSRNLMEDRRSTSSSLFLQRRTSDCHSNKVGIYRNPRFINSQVLFFSGTVFRFIEESINVLPSHIK